jgi:pyruvate,water dikinase
MIRAGLPVPGGFVVTAEAYRRFLDQSGLGTRIEEALRRAPTDDASQLERVSSEIQEMIRGASMPPDVRRALVDAYAQLKEEVGTGREPPFVAVRSSGTVEDSAQFSFAGMFQSFLNVRGVEALSDRVKECWASAFGPRALAYRRRQGIEGEGLVAVVVQRMVESEKSGVLFTANPTTGNKDRLVIEAAFGLGEVVVLGQLTPDRYEVDKLTRRTVSTAVGDKTFMLVRDPESGENRRVNLDGARAGARVLSDAEVAALSDLGVRLEAHYGVPQDAEWAIHGKRVYLVQTRPITTLGAKGGSDSVTHPDAQSLTGSVRSGRVLVRGLSASPGIASGRVRVLLDPSQAGLLREGDVLVASTTTPDWMPVMRKAVAIVTDAGGTTSHAAIVSRELGIPCVVGTRQGTKALQTGTLVTVDGGTGEVTEGARQRLPAGCGPAQAAGPGGQGSRPGGHRPEHRRPAWVRRAGRRDGSGEGGEAAPHKGVVVVL